MTFGSTAITFASRFSFKLTPVYVIPVQPSHSAVYAVAVIVKVSPSGALADLLASFAWVSFLSAFDVPFLSFVDGFSACFVFFFGALTFISCSLCIISDDKYFI